MIKFNAGFSEECEAYLIGFGLSEDNLSLLLEGKPLRVVGAALNLPMPGCDFAIVAGHTHDDIEKVFNEIADKVYQHAKSKVTKVPALHIDNGFYVLPLFRADNKTLYVIGLNDESYRRLRAGKELTFRARPADEQAMTPIELKIFSNVTEEAITERLKKEGYPVQ